MIRKQITDPMFPECPVRNVLAHIGDKWTTLVLMALDEAGTPLRYRDIRRAIPDISQKMLSVTLRNLEADGLVVRAVYAEVPPRVEYALTDRSRSLLPHIHSLTDWALDNLSDIVNSRRRFAEGHPQTI